MYVEPTPTPVRVFSLGRGCRDHDHELLAGPPDDADAPVRGHTPRVLDVFVTEAKSSSLRNCRWLPEHAANGSKTHFHPDLADPDSGPNQGVLRETGPYGSRRYSDNQNAQASQARSAHGGICYRADWEPLNPRPGEGGYARVGMSERAEEWIPVTDALARVDCLEQEGVPVLGLELARITPDERLLLAAFADFSSTSGGESWPFARRLLREHVPPEATHVTFVT